MKNYIDFFTLLYIFTYNIIKYISVYLYNLIYKIDNTKNRFNTIKNLSKKLLKLNVNYIKIIQILALNNNYLTCEENNYLIQFTDNVPYKYEDINFNIINYLKNNNVTFDNETPINCGISALVYKGLYKNKKVAIKILKNNAEINLSNCFDTLEIFINIFSLCNNKSIINIKSIFNENKRILLNQIDMINEKNNINTFYKKCENFDYLNIPSVYNVENIANIDTSICSNYDNKYIVMDFIDGISINELLRINNKELNNIFARNIIKFGLISIFFTNAIHYDLHPGNIIFKIIDKNSSKCLNYSDIYHIINNNIFDINNYNCNLGLIDFGIVFFPNKNSQDIFYSFFNMILIDKEYKNAAELMIDNFIRIKLNNSINEYIPESIYNEVSNVIEQIFKNYFGKNIEFNLDFFHIINKALSKYNLIFTDEFSKMLLSLSIPNNLTKKLIDGESIAKTTTNLLNELSKIKFLITF